MSAPRFTVLMPTHYRADIIGLAIQSVLAQTESSFELLVVGDGAEPGTAEQVGAIDDPRVRWFDFPKAPSFGYANRNLALEEALGELVVFAADDDLMLPDHLERMGAVFADPTVQWAHSQALWVSADGIAGPDLTNLQLPDEREYFVLHGNTLAAGAVAYRASAFSARTPWPEGVKEAGDWLMWRSLLDMHGSRGLRVIPEATLLHFTAGRKDRRDSGFGLLAAYLGVAERVAWWPTALRPAIGEGEPAQATYWRALQQPGGVEAIRAAARLVVDRMALDFLAPRVPGSYGIGAERIALEQTRSALALAREGLGTVQAELARVSAEVGLAHAKTEAAQADRAAVQHQLDAMRNSTIWRAAAPLRAVMHRLRGQRVL